MYVYRNPLDLFKLFGPMCLGYITNRLPGCNYRLRKSAGETVKFRPPPYVFGIVWPILYILFGLCWVNSGNTHLKNGVYFIITILLTLWIVAYSCMNKKKYGIYILLKIIFFIIVLMNLIDTTCRLLLTPLLTWIIFALLLNMFEVQAM